MHMGVTVSVISGKGGTGKTTLCAGIAACLAAEGKRVLCIDADIGLRNLDIALGMAEQPAVAFTDVTQGFCKLSDAAEHPALPGLFLLTAPVREQDALVEQQRFGALLREAREAFDWVLIDAAAGIGTSFRLATQFADRCIVAATLRDAACAADALAIEGHELLQLVVNRVQPRLFSRMHLTVDDMMDQTGLPLLGLVPEDPAVVLSAAAGKALILNSSGGAAEACLRISRRLRGAPMPLMRF